MKKIILLIFTLLIATSCKAKKENNESIKEEINYLFSLMSSNKPPGCVLDCPGIENSENDFCVWLISVVNNDCLSDCGKVTHKGLLEMAGLCQNSANDETFMQTLKNRTIDALSNEEFQNLTDVIEIELLIPNKKIKSISYNNRQELENNKSVFVILNSTNQKIKLDWIDFNGNLKSKGYIDSEGILEHESFNGHAFQLSNAKTNEILNHFIVPKGKGIVIIK